MTKNEEHLHERIRTLVYANNMLVERATVLQWRADCLSKLAISAAAKVEGCSTEEAEVKVRAGMDNLLKGIIAEAYSKGMEPVIEEYQRGS